MLLDVDVLLDRVQVLDGDLARLLEAIRDFERVNAFVEELLSLFQDGAGKHNNTGRSIADLVVLRSGQLDQQLGGLVMDLSLVSNGCGTYLHLLEDSGSVIRDDDLAVRRHQHFVHASRAQ